MRRQWRAALVGTLFVLAVWAAASGLWLGLFRYRAAMDADRFDFVLWEAGSLPNRLLFDLGGRFRSDPPVEAAIARYFVLPDRITEEARRLENVVEREIERRVEAVLHTEGIGWLSVGALPPVDAEFAAAPRVLVISPRDRIERLRTTPLRPDLTRDRIEAIEAREERAENRSALVVRAGGIATFPAIVVPDDEYEWVVSTVAHEWLHHYLAAYPLGMGYFADADQRTINETVADVFGDRVAEMVIARYGRPAVSRPVASSTAPPAVDVTATLRELRLRVDALLATGNVAEAERAMEEARRHLAAQGVSFRRINQAYFAWVGTYASRPDSVDPLGGQLRALLTQSGSLREFVEQVRETRTREDVVRLMTPPRDGAR